MIEYIKGTIASLNPAEVVVETPSGLAFGLNISLATFTALSGVSATRLLVHEVIREDAYTLYGFVTEDERALFRLLVGVSGVGANTARMLQSSLSVDELRQAIVGDDVKRLKSVKGVGAKTAERIIVDLRDKIKVDEAALIEQTPAASEAFDEALTALTILGYQRAQAQKVLKKLFDSDPTLRVETAIRKALAML